MQKINQKIKLIMLALAALASLIFYLPQAQAVSFTSTDGCKIDWTITKPDGNTNAASSFTIYKDQLSGYRANVQITGGTCKDYSVKASIFDNPITSGYSQIFDCTALNANKEKTGIDFSTLIGSYKKFSLNLFIYKGTDCTIAATKDISILATYSDTNAPANQQVKDASVPAVEVINNPIQSATFIALAFRTMKQLTLAIAALAIIFIIIGGVELMLSRGNQEMVTRGRDTIIWALVGVVAALMSFSIVAVVQNLLS